MSSSYHASLKRMTCTAFIMAAIGEQEVARFIKADAGLHIALDRESTRVRSVKSNCMIHRPDRCASCEQIRQGHDYMSKQFYGCMSTSEMLDKCI